MSKIYLFDNEDTVKALQLDRERRLASLSIKGASSELDGDGLVIVTNFQAQFEDQGQLSPSLGGVSYYQSFGDRPVPVQVTGLAFHALCDSDGTPGVDRLLEWYSQNKPSVSDSGQVTLITLQISGQASMPGILRSVRISATSDRSRSYAVPFTLDLLALGETQQITTP